MAVEPSLAFDNLVEQRRRLEEFCRGEFDGITAFKSGASFQVYQNEGQLPPGRAHHLSSSATCYELLLECPKKFIPTSGADVTADAKQFVQLALARPPQEWTSDGSAAIYCRCRALPVVIGLADG